MTYVFFLNLKFLSNQNDLENNISADGKLDTDRFLRALLTKRNTPDPFCKMSPAQIIFWRNLRDALPRINKNINIFHNDSLRTEWRDAWRQKDSALRIRYQGCQQRLLEHTRDLPPLAPGDKVAVQNQQGAGVINGKKQALSLKFVIIINM